MATARCREFVITDGLSLMALSATASGGTVTSGAAEVPQRIAAALEPRFRVVQETRRRTRLVWLDTFDWRLHAAGLVLRQVNGPGPGELVLTTGAGETVLSQPLARLALALSPANGRQPSPPQEASARRSRWPGRLVAVPDGPLRDRLGRRSRCAALLPLARADGTLTRLRVLDDEHKTVARITVEDRRWPPPAHSAAGPATQTRASGPLPPRLLITPVRGYSAAAQRTARLLGAADGFTPATEPAFTTVLAAAGRQPGDYTGKIDVKLSPATPARQALATVLLRLADTIEANVGYVLRDVDTEFLHDLRVAVRRTRSALKLAGDALPDGLADRFAPEFRWLGDLTTPTRDLDVYLEGFGQMAARLARPRPATSTRSAPTWSPGAPPSAASWSAGCARPGSAR